MKKKTQDVIHDKTEKTFQSLNCLTNALLLYINLDTEAQDRTYFFYQSFYDIRTKLKCLESGSLTPQEVSVVAVKERKKATKQKCLILAKAFQLAIATATSLLNAQEPLDPCFKCCQEDHWTNHHKSH